MRSMPARRRSTSCPKIREALGSRALVLLDGGVRSGTDILRAMALGANVVAVGRPLVYGLTVAGPEGVRRVFEMFEEEFRAAMAFCGLTALGDINPAVFRVRETAGEILCRAQAAHKR